MSTEQSVFYNMAGDVSDKFRGHAWPSGDFSSVQILDRQAVLTGEYGDKLPFVVRVVARKKASIRYPSEEEMHVMDHFMDIDYPVEDLRRRERHSVRILKNEIGILRHLEGRGNSFVPRVLEEGDDWFDMNFIEGTSGKRLEIEGGVATRLALFEMVLGAVESVYQDGVTSLDYAPRNCLFQLDKEGFARSVMLIDFGHGLLIDDEGMVAVSRDLVDGNFWWTPAEARKHLKEVESVRVDGEKLTIAALGTVLRGLFSRDHAMDDVPEEVNEFTARMEARNPQERPSLREVRRWVEEHLDRENVGPCLSGWRLSRHRREFGKTYRKVVISEREADRIGAQLEELSGGDGN